MLHLQLQQTKLAHLQSRPRATHLLVVVGLAVQMLAASLEVAAESAPFRFSGFSDPPSPPSPPEAPETTASGPTSAGLIWQPLRATFRPLNRPTPPPTPEEPAIPEGPPTPTPSPALSSSQPSSLSSLIESAESLLDDEQPTRQPLSRFRPTRAPVQDPTSATSGSHLGPPAPPDNHTERHLSSSGFTDGYQISPECFECICEASTNCNTNSRCQTSDVRHTRCGLFLISYQQWLDTGLSKELVSREALAKDAAADERAFYECVTSRSCAERLLAIYMQRHLRDCDKDGRLDCYDVAAIHQGGPGSDQCQSETLLESQYWSDFNACFGFGARRR